VVGPGTAEAVRTHSKIEAGRDTIIVVKINKVTGKKMNMDPDS
jgi:hypothetical protein